MKNDAIIRYDEAPGSLPPCPPVPSPEIQAEKLRELLLDIVDEKLAEIIVTALTEDVTDQEIPSALAVWGLKEEVDQMSEYADEAAASAAAAASSAEDAETAQSAAEDAAAAAASSATAAAGSATAAAESATSAASSATSAADDATDAASAKTAAEAAQAAAEAAVTAAEAAGAEQIELIEAAGASERESLSGYTTRAETAAENAEASAESIQGSVSDAAEYATAAGESATAAASSATQAVTAKTAAVSAKTAAEAAQAAAEAAQGDAEAAGTAAEAAQEAAEAAQTAAESAQSDAEDAATAAGESATAAGNSATVAENKATAAGNAATLAENKATLAGESAIAAAASAAAAEAAATDVLNKATVITDTASGAIASFPDGADEPIKQLTVKILPQQDLHGYENPWPAGGTKNKLPNAIAKTETVNGVTFTLNQFGVFTVKGTATANAYCDFPIGKTIVIPSGNPSPKLALGNSQAKTEAAFRFLNNGTQVDSWTLSPAARTATYSILQGKSVDTYQITVSSGTTVDMTISPMIVENSVMDYSFIPYSNLCPITGWTGAEVTRTGANLFDITQLLTATDWTYDSTTGEYSGTSANLYATFGRDAGDHLIAFPNGCDRQLTVCAYFAQNSSGKGFGISFVYTDGSIDNSTPTSGENYQWYKYTSAAGKTVSYIRYTYNNGKTLTIKQFGIFVDSGSTDADKFDYTYTGTTYPITFPSEAGTVYGGTVTVNQDGTGTLKVTDATKTFNGGDTETWARSGSSGSALHTYYITGLNSTTFPYAFKDGVRAISNQYKFKGNTSGNYSTFLSNGEFGLYVTSTSGITLRQAFFQNSSISTVDEWTAALAQNPIVVCYELATPVTYTLTVEQTALITTLYGQNNVWSNTGDTSVTYRADTKLYIDKKLAALLAALS